MSEALLPPRVHGAEVPDMFGKGFALSDPAHAVEMVTLSLVGRRSWGGDGDVAKGAGCLDAVVLLP